MSIKIKKEIFLIDINKIIIKIKISGIIIVQINIPLILKFSKKLKI